MADLQRGVVKWFNDAKGFGFIEHTSGKDVFVHYSLIEWEGFKTLKDGEEVEYELSEGDKGLHAARVLRKIPKPQAQKPSTDNIPISEMLEVENLSSSDSNNGTFQHQTDSEETTSVDSAD